MNAAPPVLFGEVLFDRFPDGSSVLGGAPLNVALHLQAFGLAPLLLSAVGVDLLGEQILARMEAAGLDTTGVAVDPQHPTDTVEVALADDEPTFTITPDVAWDCIDVERAPAQAGLLYHGSLALRRVSARTAFARLRERLAAPVFLDVNLRAPWWSRGEVRELIGTARWVKLNHDELDALADGGDEPSRAAELLTLGDLELVVVTRGADGAAAYSHDGAPIEVVPERAAEVVDTVGAGDAFASVLICGLVRGWPLTTTLDRAQAFASRIVACRGAVPEDPGFHAPTLASWENA